MPISGGFLTGPTSGTFIGDGSGLTGIVDVDNYLPISGGFLTGPVSGTFVGDGSGLTGIVDVDNYLPLSGGILTGPVSANQIVQNEPGTDYPFYTLSATITADADTSLVQGQTLGPYFANDKSIYDHQQTQAFTIATPAANTTYVGHYHQADFSGITNAIAPFHQTYGLKYVFTPAGVHGQYGSFNP